MPYRSGVIQMALGAFCAAAFLISNAFGSDPRQKRLVGIIQKTGEQTFILTEDNARQHKLEVAESAPIFLNEKQISFAAVENGRKARIDYEKKQGQIFATLIDVFPTHSDSDATDSTTEG